MKKIKALAEGLYEKYGSCDPFRLCGELSVNIFKSPLPSSVSGFYYNVDGQSVIIVNEALKPPKDSFVAAHELGHALLHPNTNSFFMKTKTALETGRFERQADYFAACLLLCKWKESAEFSDLSIDSLSSVTGIDPAALEAYKREL